MGSFRRSGICLRDSPSNSSLWPHCRTFDPQDIRCILLKSWMADTGRLGRMGRCLSRSQSNGQAGTRSKCSTLSWKPGLQYKPHIHFLRHTGLLDTRCTRSRRKTFQRRK